MAGVCKELSLSLGVAVRMLILSFAGCVNGYSNTQIKDSISPPPSAHSKAEHLISFPENLVERCQPKEANWSHPLPQLAVSTKALS